MRRVNPGSEEGFVGVDVPDSGDTPLIEEHRLHRSLCVGTQGAKIPDREVEAVGPQQGPAGL